MKEGASVKCREIDLPTRVSYALAIREGLRQGGVITAPWSAVRPHDLRERFVSVALARGKGEEE
jgi:hypothetical protein